VIAFRGQHNQNIPLVLPSKLMIKYCRSLQARQDKNGADFAAAGRHFILFKKKMPGIL